jgi:hypothetical protein
LGTALTYRTFITFAIFASKGSVEFVARQALRLELDMRERDNAGDEDGHPAEDDEEDP